MLKANKKSQSFVMYAALIAILSVALIAMFSYVKRSIQGKYRDAGDAFGGGAQYEIGVSTTEEIIEETFPDANFTYQEPTPDDEEE